MHKDLEEKYGINFNDLSDSYPSVIDVILEIFEICAEDDCYCGYLSDLLFDWLYDQKWCKNANQIADNVINCLFKEGE